MPVRRAQRGHCGGLGDITLKTVAGTLKVGSQ